MTKKHLILAGLVALFLTPSSQIKAQAALFVLIFGDKVASENFHLSLDVGLNVSQMSGFNDGKILVGLNFGLGTHIKLNDRWFLAPEFKPLSPKGARDVSNPIELPTEFEGSGSNSKIKLNYIEVPVLIQHRLPIGLYFSAGPQFSFLSSASQQTEITLTNGTVVDIEQDLKDDFKGFDWGFPVEIGYAWKDKRKGKGLDLRVRYAYGFNEVFEETTSRSANHSTFQFMLTFPFVENVSKEE